MDFVSFRFQMDESILLSDAGEDLQIPSEPKCHYITAVPTVVEDGSVSYILIIRQPERTISPIEDADEHREKHCQITEQQLDIYEIDSEQTENNPKKGKRDLDSYEIVIDQPENNCQLIEKSFNNSDFENQQPENISQIIIQSSIDFELSENICQIIQQPFTNQSVNNLDGSENIKDEEEAISQLFDDDDKSKIEKIGNKKCRERINCSICNYTTDRR